MDINISLSLFFFAEELQFKPIYMQCTMIKNSSPNPQNSNQRDSVSMERSVIRRTSCHLVVVSYSLIKPKLTVTKFSLVLFILYTHLQYFGIDSFTESNLYLKLRAEPATADMRLLSKIELICIDYCVLCAVICFCHMEQIS